MGLGPTKAEVAARCLVASASESAMAEAGGFEPHP